MPVIVMVGDRPLDELSDEERKQVLETLRRRVWEAATRAALLGSGRPDEAEETA